MLISAKKLFQEKCLQQRQSVQLKTVFSLLHYKKKLNKSCNYYFQQRTHPEKNAQSIIIVGLNRQNLHSDLKMQESMVS
jgi:hypothetical protein